MNNPTARKRLVNEWGSIPLFLQIQLTVGMTLSNLTLDMRDMLPQLQYITIPRHPPIMADHHY